MEPPITPPRNRPPVLRTYGKTKREAPLFPLLSSPPPLSHSDSFRSSDESSCLPSSETGFSEGDDNAVGIRSDPPAAMMDALMDERSSMEGLQWVKKETKSTSGSDSPASIIIPTSTSTVNSLKLVSRGRKSCSKPIPGPTSGQSTLRAFFAPRPTMISPLPSGSRLRTETFVASTNPPNSPTLPKPTSTSSFSPSTPLLPTTTQPKKLVQMHFKRSSPSSPSSSFTTCKKCNLSYIQDERSSYPDTSPHLKNCERVTRGMVWDEPRGVGVKGLGKEVRAEVGFERRGQDGARGKGKRVGRIVQVDGSDGVNNTKITDILSSIDTVLSAPSLPPSTLKQCQIFLFLTSCPPPPPGSGKRLVPSAISSYQRRGKEKERVVGCVVTQGIRWGMRVVGKEEKEGDENDGLGGKRKREGLVVVETSSGVGSDDGGILCYPERIPVKMGVHRIFTVPSFRGCGIIRSLLDEACKHTNYGYKCDPLKGDVAFSQPTQSGRRVMNTWGEGKVLVFNEDEQEDDTLDEG